MLRIANADERNLHEYKQVVSVINGCKLWQFWCLPNAIIGFNKHDTTLANSQRYYWNITGADK